MRSRVRTTRTARQAPANTKRTPPTPPPTTTTTAAAAAATPSEPHHTTLHHTTHTYPALPRYEDAQDNPKNSARLCQVAPTPEEDEDRDAKGGSGTGTAVSAAKTGACMTLDGSNGSRSSVTRTHDRKRKPSDLPSIAVVEPQTSSAISAMSTMVTLTLTLTHTLK